MSWKVSAYVENRQGETDLRKADGELITEERWGATNIISGLLPSISQKEIDLVLDEGGTLTGTFDNPDGSFGTRTVVIEVR